MTDSLPQTAIMDRLRTETRGLHTKAEQHPFQKSMIQAQIGRPAYGAWLGQMLLVHRALDGAIASHRSSVESLGIVEDRQFQEPYLLDDLKVFGIDPSGVAPTAATSRLIADIEATVARDPIELLGLFYVLEGANNGNRFIVRALRPALRLEPGTGDRYLDPYGDEQPALWASFKERMGGLGLDADVCDRIVVAAERMFEGVIEISDDLMPTVTVASGSDAGVHA